MNKRTVCVVTGSRAEYGLFYPVMKKINSAPELDLQIVATTMHLSQEFGNTYKCIEDDGFVIDEKVENLLVSDSKSSVTKSAGLAMVLLSDTFSRLQPDVVLLLGDRYETHAAASAAMLMNIPVAHIHGGEITEGAVDEKIRHSITKMSYLHFTSTEKYRQRVIQMGEDPLRVITSGAPGIDNIIDFNLLSKSALEDQLGWSFGEQSALFTYHPVTLSSSDIDKDMEYIFAAIEKTNFNVLFTYSNSDDSGRKINQKIEAFCQLNPVRYKVVKNLGQLRYLSAVKQVNLLIGNTSSGIIEAASYFKPVVNIGDRQKGREQSGNVIDCTVNDIDIAIEKALNDEFIEKCKKVINIYGNGYASDKIVAELSRVKLSLVKKFFDLKTD